MTRSLAVPGSEASASTPRRASRAPLLATPRDLQIPRHEPPLARQ